LFGIPDRNAMTRATFAASAGWRHNQKITSSMTRDFESGALEQRRYDDAPSFDSIEAARSVPALQNGSELHRQ